MELNELAPWTAPAGYRIDSGIRRALSLERPRPFPSATPRGEDAHDLKWWDTWIPHPGTGLTPAVLVNAWRQAELGHPWLQCDVLADQIERDAHARSTFDHRERVVAKSPATFTASDDTSEGQLAARVLQFAMGRVRVGEHAGIRAAFGHLLRVNRDGYSGAEIDWDVFEVDGRRWIVPCYLTLVPARRFRIGVQGMIPVAKYPDGTDTGEREVRFDDLRLYQVTEFPQGHPLRPGKWITMKSQPSQVARGGLGRTASTLLMAKSFSFRDWIVLSQRYGIPWPIATYPDGASDELVNIAKTIISNIGNDGGAAIPQNIELELKDGVKGKDPMQDRFVAFCNNELSKLVNGSTLTNDHGSAGSYGLGSVHQTVSWENISADGEMLAEAIDRCICEPFYKYNALAGEPPKCSLICQPDLSADQFMALAVKGKNELGIGISKKQVRERTGLHEPIDDDDDCPGMQVEKFPTPAGGPP